MCDNDITRGIDRYIQAQKERARVYAVVSATFSVNSMAALCGGLCGFMFAISSLVIRDLSSLLFVTGVTIVFCLFTLSMGVLLGPDSILAKPTREALRSCHLTVLFWIQVIVMFTGSLFAVITLALVFSTANAGINPAPLGLTFFLMYLLNRLAAQVRKHVESVL